MTTTRYITGDVRDTLDMLADEGTTVDLVLTSPPFLALRSYLPADHPDKHREIGSEPTPAAFLSTMLHLVDQCERVLSPWGTLAFEFGDTYSGSGGGGGDYLDGGMREGQAQFAGSSATARESNAAHWRQKNAAKSEWPLPKSLCMIPSLFSASLAYGRNLLDPVHEIDPWRIRNIIRWVRPNPPVGALGDKFRPATSEITIACKAKDRWFDLDAVRTEHKADPEKYTGNGYTKGQPEGDGDPVMKGNPAGAPPLDWWKVSPSGYQGSHYAVYPPELLRTPIEAMCPRRVCRTCGVPSRREVDHQRLMDGQPVDPVEVDWSAQRKGSTAIGFDHNRVTSERTTTGWTSCGCEGTDGIRLDGYHTGAGWRPGVVLDPFGGSGTTGFVANGLGREAILIDIDERNVDLARERIGMFMVHEYLAERVA